MRVLGRREPWGWAAGPEDEGTRAHDSKSDVSSSADKLRPPHALASGPGSQRTSSRLGAGTSQLQQALRPQVCAGRSSGLARWGSPQPSWGCCPAALQEHQGDTKRQSNRRLGPAEMDQPHGSTADVGCELVRRPGHPWLWHRWVGPAWGSDSPD